MYNKNNKKKKVVLALWADPSYYLATIFTSQFLSKNDFEVDLVYRKSSPLNNLLDHIEFGKNTLLHPVGNFQNGLLSFFKYLNKEVDSISLLDDDNKDINTAHISKKIFANFFIRKNRRST